MNSQQAKSILKVYRPSEAGAAGPQVAEALEQVQRDPELAQWFAEQQSFDAAMASAVKTTPVPADLKAAILNQGKVVEPVGWPNWRLRLAVAAVLVVLVSVATIWVRRADSFVDYRREMIQSSWPSPQHLDFVSSDLKQVRQWLSQHNAPADFKLPSALQGVHVWGARVLEWQGQQVSFVCFLDGIKHRHLFVIDGKSFRDLPASNSPDFEKCRGWKTVSWSQGDNVYVLTGMNYLTFVKKCRKAGQWVMTG